MVALGSCCSTMVGPSKAQRQQNVALMKAGCIFECGKWMLYVHSVVQARALPGEVTAAEPAGRGVLLLSGQDTVIQSKLLAWSGYVKVWRTLQKVKSVIALIIMQLRKRPLNSPGDLIGRVLRTID